MKRITLTTPTPENRTLESHTTLEIPADILVKDKLTTIENQPTTIIELSMGADKLMVNIELDLTEFKKLLDKMNAVNSNK